MKGRCERMTMPSEFEMSPARLSSATRADSWARVCSKACQTQMATQAMVSSPYAIIERFENMAACTRV